MAPRPRLLVADDDSLAGCLMQALFTRAGFDVTVVASGEAAAGAVAEGMQDAVILDVNLPDMSGVQVLERIKSIDPRLPVIMLTGSGDIPSAVRATQLGAFAYLSKGGDLDEVVVVARRAIESRALAAEVEELKRRLGQETSLSRLMGPSREVASVVEQVAQVAPSDFTVLVQGETGTGKDLVARAIHRESPRRDKPFIALDCGAIPENLVESELFGHVKGAFTGADKPRTGHFQLAEGGTLFLDEIANLPLPLQAKLLRVLQDKQARPLGGHESVPLDVRFVVATNRDLQAAVAAGEFRQDLYFRLAEFTITLPALRDRIEDVRYLAWRIAEEASVELRRPVREISADAFERLLRHRWPGNVRELRNVIRLAVLQCYDMVISSAHVRSVLERGQAATPETAPRPFATHPGVRGQSLKAIATAASELAEKAAIVRALEAARGNKSEAARALQTDYKTLHLKIRRYGLGARDQSAG